MTRRSAMTGAGCVAQPDHRIAAEDSQAFAAIGFDLPEPLAFAADGLHKPLPSKSLYSRFLSFAVWQMMPVCGARVGP